MPYIIAKYLLTAAVIVLISELAKRSDKLGALIASLPLVTIVTLIWLHLDQQPTARSQIMPTTRFGMSYRHCRCFSFFRCCSKSLAFGRR